MAVAEKFSVISIYVSHNSEAYIKRFSDRHKGELGKKVFLVNSSLNSIDENKFPDFEVINIGGNIGFAAANNAGIEQGIKLEPDYILIVNPDVFLPASWLMSVLEVINGLQRCNVGAFIVPLLGYDFEKDKPTGLVDSMGMSYTWYGRWFDVSKGGDVNALDKKKLPYEVQAACGALVLIHKDVVCELLEKDGFVFNESYFMYKEDIELSLRIRRLGKSILMIPSAPAFHCRGWAKERADSPDWARKLSSLNELKMHLKYCWRFLPYSFIKYFYVRFFERFMLKFTKSVK